MMGAVLAQLGPALSVSVAHESVDGPVASDCDIDANVLPFENEGGTDKMGANPNLNETVERFKMLGVKGPTVQAFDFTWTQMTAYQAKE